MGIVILKIKPNSKKQAVGFKKDMIQIYIKSPARQGKANAELLKFMHKILKVPESEIKIKRGLSSRMKTLEVESLSREEIINKLKE